jgi:tetratricopeptide (TPR) repeat protein
MLKDYGRNEAKPMTSFSQDFINKIKEIEDKKARGEYFASLRLLESLLQSESSKSSSYLLTLRAELIQLINETPEEKWSLESAEDNLRNAVALDPSSVNARLELGWFLNNVLDKPEEAKMFFEEGLKIGLKQLESIMLGRVECINDLNGPRAALAAIEEIEKLFPNSEKLTRKRSFFKDAVKNQES